MKRLSQVITLAGMLLLAACSEQGPAPLDLASNAADGAIACTVTMSTRNVNCDSPNPSAARGLLFNLNLGGPQGTYVTLASSTPTYVGTAFSSTVTVENRGAQPLGTANGTTPHADAIRVAIVTGPTVTGGTGTVTVANPDGTATITAANQPYFSYTAPLAPGLTTTGKTWTFTVPATVTQFTFGVLVNARVPDEVGVLRWAQQAAGTAPLDEIDEACGNLWAVGGTSAVVGPPAVPATGVIMRYNGTAWAAEDNPVPTQVLHSVEMHCSGTTATGVAVGEGGTILYYSGTAWTSVGPGGTATLMSVSRAGTEWWACGLDGVILHSANGQTGWAAQESNEATDPDFFYCGGPAANNVYAAGEGGFLTHYNGTTWSATGYASGTTQTIRASVAVSATERWLFGDAGTITHATNGLTFTAQTSGTTQNLYGAEVFSTSPVNLYAVGLAGTVLNYNGTAWTTQRSNSDEVRNDVAFRFATAGGAFQEAWAVGNGAAVRGLR
jgi:hypothetical protein